MFVLTNDHVHSPEILFHNPLQSSSISKVAVALQATDEQVKF